MPSISRRRVLRRTSIGFTVVTTGCATNDASPRELHSSTSPQSTSTPVQNGSAGPAPSCPDGYSSINPTWVVEGPGPLTGFDLLLDSREIELGDTLTCELRNVAGEENSSGNKKKYDIQYQTGSGWHTIFGTDKPMARTDEGILHSPGSGFTWKFSFTEEGLSNIVENDGYYACGPIESGTYRFVYVGITTAREAKSDYEPDYALGVPFSVTEN